MNLQPSLTNHSVQVCWTIHPCVHITQAVPTNLVTSQVTRIFWLFLQQHMSLWDVCLQLFCTFGIESLTLLDLSKLLGSSNCAKEVSHLLHATCTVLRPPSNRPCLIFRHLCSTAL